MARIDVPTMQCDRCKWVTTDEHAISMFTTIEWYSDPVAQKRAKQDLCRECYISFVDLFLGNHTAPSVVI